jgi:hypothetical protein
MDLTPRVTGGLQVRATLQPLEECAMQPWGCVALVVRRKP